MTPTPDDPGTDDPGTDEPGTEQPGTDDPGPDDPGTGEPSDGSPIPFWQIWEDGVLALEEQEYVTLDFISSVSLEKAICIKFLTFHLAKL